MGRSLFPSINIHNADNLFDSTFVGPSSSFADTGMFQNNFEVASSLQSVHGRHTLSIGFNFDYTQLNIINRNEQLASLNFADFPGFLQGRLCTPTFSCSGQPPSELLSGGTSRHYRTKQAGAYVQDKFRPKPNLTVDIGLRWDWDGPLYETNGLLSNFYPQNYSYDVASDTITNIGLVIAGNNKTFPTKGVSNSTLTGRQWGFAPRIGVAYSPSFVKNLVVRAGFGMYYDRGEYFTELSPPAGGRHQRPVRRYGGRALRSALLLSGGRDFRGSLRHKPTTTAAQRFFYRQDAAAQCFHSHQPDDAILHRQQSHLWMQPALLRGLRSQEYPALLGKLDS